MDDLVKRLWDATLTIASTPMNLSLQEWGPIASTSQEAADRITELEAQFAAIPHQVALQAAAEGWAEDWADAMRIGNAVAAAIRALPKEPKP